MSVKAEEIQAQDRWLIPSNTTQGVTYTVTRTKDGMLKCDCKAGQRGTFCRHKKGVSQHEENVAKAEAIALDKEVGQMSLGDFIAPAETEDKLDKESKTVLGYDFKEVTSALQKEIRAGDAEAAVYWGLLLYGKSPGYTWKRLIVIAAEDIGFADQEAVQFVNALAAGWKLSSERSFYVSPHSMVMSIVRLAEAEKSVMVDDMINYVKDQIKQGVMRPMKERYLCMHTKRGREAGRGDPHWYGDRHLTCKIPINEYTEKLYKAHPEWFPVEMKQMFERPFETPEEAHDRKNAEAHNEGHIETEPENPFEDVPR